VSVNPYEAPKAKVADAATLGTRIPLAGRGARFVNLILDAVFSTIVSLAFGVALGMAGAGPWFARLNRFEAQLIDWVFYVLYYTAFELSFGWTLAKLITGTRVVDERGERPSPGKIVGRSFARLVPFEPLSFLGKTGIGWHDRWSGTRVVSVRRTSGATLEDSFKPGFRSAAGGAGHAGVRADRRPAGVVPELRRADLRHHRALRPLRRGLHLARRVEAAAQPAVARKAQAI